MIIKGIKASNFMRFEKFELMELPEHGLIGIFGENESGKSSLGELICFLLFGRNTRAPGGEPDRIIRWGEGTCNAEMEIAIGELEYRITRRLSRDGSTDGSLVSTSTNEVLASSAEDIEEAVSALLGYGFKEFRYSTFIAQNELDIILRSADDRRLVLNNMLGVGFMEKMVEKVQAKRMDREKEVQAVLRRLDDKKEVLQVYTAREKDMERVVKRMDRGNEKLLSCIKEQDHARSTISLLNEVRRKAELFEVLDMRIKKRREELKVIETQCSALLRDVDRVPKYKQENKEKEALVGEIQSGVLKRLQEKFQALEKYRELGSKHQQVLAQIDLKESALNEVTDKLRDIEKWEEELQAGRKEHAAISYFINTFAGAEKFRTTVSCLMKDLDLLNSEIDKVQITHDKDLEMIDEREAAFASQKKRLRRQVEAATLREVDKDEISKVQAAERSASLARDVGLGLGFACLALGMVLTLALGNVSYLLALLGMIPTWGASILFQSRARNVSQTHQQMQQQIYAFNITQRGLVELQETEDDIEKQILNARNKRAKVEKINDTLKQVKTDCFDKLEESIKFLIGSSIRELDRASALGREILDSYYELRNLVNDDTLHFKEYLNFDHDHIIAGKVERQKSLEKDIGRLETAVEAKNKFVDQSQSLLTIIADLKNDASKVDVERIAIGVTEEDLPDLQCEELDIEDRIKRLENEIEESKKTIIKIEGQAEEAARLQERRSIIIDEIDEDLIKHYELREATYDIDCGEERFKELNRKIGELDSYILEHRQSIRDIDGERKIIRKDLDRIPRVQEEIDKIEEDLNEKETYILKLHELDNLFKQTGHNIRKRLVPQIEAYFGWVLPKMTRGRYHRVRLDDDFNIMVFSEEYGDFVNIDVLSGGTIDQLLISLRLAFARATFTNADSLSQFLFLDEPFSSFDESRREQFFNMLRILKSNFQQIFLISHLPNLEDLVDYYLRMDISKKSLPAATSWIQM